jgi:hypothetical protein
MESESLLGSTPEIGGLQFESSVSLGTVAGWAVIGIIGYAVAKSIWKNLAGTS